MENRAPFLFALLLLLFFVSTSAGFADISAIQDQLQIIQLKIIGEKLKAIQRGVLGIAPTPPPPAAPPPQSPKADAPTQAELSRTLERQIQILQGVVATLQPQAISEEAARIENRIAEIGEEVKKATGDTLLALQDELARLAAQQDTLQQQIRVALEDSIKHKQTQFIREQIRVLQEKIAILPRPSTVPNPPVVQQNATLMEIQDKIQKLQLRVLQTQVKVIQEKVLQITR